MKGVIFDADGVLIDSMFIWKDLGVRYLKRQGIEAEPGLSEILFSMSMEQGAEYLKEHYHLPYTPGEVLAGISDMLDDFYFYEAKCKPGTEELLSQLKDQGLAVTVATSSPREHVSRCLERNGVLKYVDKLFTTSEHGTSKHEPLIYDLAAEYMNALPEETMVFEDSLYAIKTAKGAGYYVVGVRDENGEMDQDGVKNCSDAYVECPRDYLK